MAGHGLDVEPVAELTELVGVLVDHRDVVALQRQLLGHRGPDLAGAQNDDLHSALPAERGGLGIQRITQTPGGDNTRRLILTAI